MCRVVLLLGEPVLNRLVRSVDFERALRSRSRWNSAHFALHHVRDWPEPRSAPLKPKLSTEFATVRPSSVDKRPVRDVASVVSVVSLRNDSASPAPATGHIWFGAVVPKRHARRSVTRSLLKRQIRAAVAERAMTLAGGLWVVRLRAPFDRAQFPSAASEALRRAARAEIDAVVGRAAGLSAHG